MLVVNPASVQAQPCQPKSTAPHRLQHAWARAVSTGHGPHLPSHRSSALSASSSEMSGHTSCREQQQQERCQQQEHSAQLRIALHAGFAAAAWVPSEGGYDTPQHTTTHHCTPAAPPPCASAPAAHTPQTSCAAAPPTIDSAARVLAGRWRAASSQGKPCGASPPTLDGSEAERRPAARNALASFTAAAYWQS